MSKKRMPTRKENIAYWREYLKKAGPVKALARLVKAAQDKRNRRKSKFEPSSIDLLIEDLEWAAEKDAKELLSNYNQPPFEDAILGCRTVCLAAAIGEVMLRHYLRHLLTLLFGECDELDCMVDALIKIYKHRNAMPFPLAS